MSDNMQFLQATIEQLRHQLALEQAKVKAMEEVLNRIIDSHPRTEKFELQVWAGRALDSLSVDKEMK